MLKSYTKTYFGPTNPDDLAHTWVFPFKNTPVSWHWVTWKTWSPCMCWLYRLNPPTYWPVHGLRVESMPCATIAFGCRKWRATQISLQKLQPHILWRTLAAWFIVAFTGQGKSRLVALIVCKQCFGDRTADRTRENNSDAKITSAAREKRPLTLICTILHLSERMLQNSWHTLQNFGIFLMNVAPQLKKITFAKFSPAPPINVDHSFRHYGHFVPGQHCAGGRGGSFT